MGCLHGKPASSSKTANGVFFYCGQKPSCNFFCPQNDCSYFESAISMWRNSNTRQPRCHEHKKLAKMQVVKDISKPSFGRPFFVCPNKENPCSFWQWDDKERPNCFHDLLCYTRKVKTNMYKTNEYNKVNHDNSLAFPRHPIAKMNTGFLYLGKRKKDDRN